MPTRSPIPSTDTSTCVAPAEIASYAFAIAQPVSLCAWKPMSHFTALRSSRTSTKTWRGVAMPTVSAMPIRWTPSFSAAWWTATRSCTSERNASSAEKRTSSPADSASSMGGAIASMICWIDLPCDDSRRIRLVAKRSPIPRTPVSRAARTSSRTQREWVMTFAPRPSFTICVASRCDCGEAAGEVTSTYSTPKVSSARAISSLSSVRKLARANCSPSRSVVSMSFQVGLAIALARELGQVAGRRRQGAVRCGRGGDVADEAAGGRVGAEPVPGQVLRLEEAGLELVNLPPGEPPEELLHEAVRDPLGAVLARHDDLFHVHAVPRHLLVEQACDDGLARIEAEQELVIRGEVHLQVRLVEHVQEARHLPRRHRAADGEAVALLVGQRDHHLGHVVPAGWHRDERHLVRRREVPVGEACEEVILLRRGSDRSAQRGDVLLEVEAASREVPRALHEPVERARELLARICEDGLAEEADARVGPGLLELGQVVGAPLVAEHLPLRLDGRGGVQVEPAPVPPRREVDPLRGEAARAQPLEERLDRDRAPRILRRLGEERDAALEPERLDHRREEERVVHVPAKLRARRLDP